MGQSRAELSVGADGALEFLDKNGKVVNRIVPEAEGK